MSCSDASDCSDGNYMLPDCHHTAWNAFKVFGRTLENTRQELRDKQQICNSQKQVMDGLVEQLRYDTDIFVWHDRFCS